VTTGKLFALDLDAAGVGGRWLELSAPSAACLGTKHTSVHDRPPQSCQRAALSARLSAGAES